MYVPARFLAFFRAIPYVSAVRAQFCFVFLWFGCWASVRMANILFSVKVAPKVVPASVAIFALLATVQRSEAGIAVDRRSALKIMPPFKSVAFPVHIRAPFKCTSLERWILALGVAEVTYRLFVSSRNLSTIAVVLRNKVTVYDTTTSKRSPSRYLQN